MILLQERQKQTLKNCRPQGMLFSKAFKDAEAVFGGKLPDISYKTLDKLLEMIDAKISALGGSVVDLKA